MSQSNTSVRRRSVVAGAAWAAPTIAIGSAAPAMAASRRPGLQGWVTVGKNCSRDSNDVLRIDGTGGNGAEPPNTGTRGLWIFDTSNVTQIENARITFYFPSSLGTLSWTTVSGNTNWSAPVVSTVDPPIAGYTAYTTYYSGGWQFRDLTPGTDNDYTRATGRPNFRASQVINNCGSAITAYARRTVTVDGETISFIRGPISL